MSDEAARTTLRRYRPHVLIFGAIALSTLIVLRLAWSQGYFPPGRPLDAPPLSQDASPEQVIRRYHEAQSVGDAAQVAAVTWRNPRERGSAGLRWYLRGCSVVSIEPSRPMHNSFSPVFSETRQSVVRVRTALEDEVGNAPGEYMRFVNVGRLAENGRWTYISDGTGP